MGTLGQIITNVIFDNIQPNFYILTSKRDEEIGPTIAVYTFHSIYNTAVQLGEALPYEFVSRGKSANDFYDLL